MKEVDRNDAQPLLGKMENDGERSTFEKKSKYSVMERFYKDIVKRCCAYLQ